MIHKNMKNKVINHKNGNPRKNDISNLEIKTMCTDELFRKNNDIECAQVTEDKKEIECIEMNLLD